MLCSHVEQVGLLEQELRGALPKGVQTQGDQDRVTLRIAVNADSLGTWFIGAMAQFVDGEKALVDIALDNEAVATPEFVRRYFPDGVTATALSTAPGLKFNNKDRMQAQWARRVCRRDVEIFSHWFPATQAFLDASLAGIGWGMNPASLVRGHLKSGALVELVPGRTLAVPLYWQHTRLQVPMLGRLTEAVVRAAKVALR
jgi:LysR family transcriptional regulator (chromosome initiation inhibitor)